MQNGNGYYKSVVKLANISSRSIRNFKQSNSKERENSNWLTIQL